MKTFNQVVEEEVTKYVEDYAQAITDVGGFGLAKHIKDHLTQAMNKAALAVVEEIEKIVPGLSSEVDALDREWIDQGDLYMTLALLRKQLTELKND